MVEEEGALVLNGLGKVAAVQDVDLLLGCGLLLVCVGYRAGLVWGGGGGVIERMCVLANDRGVAAWSVWGKRRETSCACPLLLA